MRSAEREVLKSEFKRLGSYDAELEMLNTRLAALYRNLSSSPTDRIASFSGSISEDEKKITLLQRIDACKQKIRYCTSMKNWIRECVDRMPHNIQFVFRSVYTNGITWSDAAEALHIRNAVLSNQLNDAIREVMTDELIEELKRIESSRPPGYKIGEKRHGTEH